MANGTTNENSQSSTNGRIWYGLTAFLLLGLLLFPWSDGMTPATTPLRFLSELPFPAGNILFACYLLAIYLYIRTVIYGQANERPAMYRFIVSIGAMAAILRFLELAVFNPTWAVIGAWLLFCIAAIAELVYLNLNH